MKFIDLAGKKFGRLVVLTRSPNVGKKTAWRCQCKCGKLKCITGSNLVSGTTVSCGCYHRDLTRKVSTKHGHRKGYGVTAEYRAWHHMKNRCYNPKSNRYQYYGKRGIKVCKKWVNHFENFLADVGRKPTKKHSLDRYPNPDGDYSPTNCRWATAKQQRANRSHLR